MPHEYELLTLACASNDGQVSLLKYAEGMQGTTTLYACLMSGVRLVRVGLDL